MDNETQNKRHCGRPPHRKRMAPWKVATMVALTALASMCSADPVSIATQRPSGASESKETDNQPKNLDFLSLSDVANATRDFRVKKTEYLCSSGECHDALKAYALLAKRLLSDPRMLGLRTRRSASPQSDSTATESGRRRYESDFYSSYSNKGRNDRYYDGYNNHHRYPDNYYDGPSSSSGYRDHIESYTSGYGGSYDDTSSSYTGSQYKNSIYSDDRDGGYGGGYGNDYGGGGYDCCGGYGGESKFLPILVVGALGILAFYLYLRTTTTSSGRRLGHEDDDDPSDVLLDGPTWLSLIHELWEQDGALEDPSCAQHTLCRMNRMAMAAPGQAGWAVSMSSLPLSYLLHHRHGRGFVTYMDASLMGRTGANCTEVFNQCSRLH